ncbi:uncharacterized protein BDFB_013055, partial [Asbolus verrucosus]
MKYLTLFFLLLVVYYSLGALPNQKQNFCQHNRCLTCVGRYCTTTCLGESCKNCPLGDCCDGTNCNICRGEICCKTQECNNCVNDCLKTCQGTTTCHYDCFQRCIPNQDNTNRTQDNGRYSLHNKNYLPVNVTTVINITNVIKSENTIHNPIMVNTTNFNNYTSFRKNYHRKQIIINGNHNNSSHILTTKYNCCEIIHPEICYTHTIRGQSGLLCYTGKHKECSQLCTSIHVHIVKSKEGHNKCITIARPPYYFCGKYVTE